jgi:hypothetical protein
MSISEAMNDFEDMSASEVNVWPRKANVATRERPFVWTRRPVLCNAARKFNVDSLA